jgi:predicted glycosyltransferase
MPSAARRTDRALRIALYSHDGMGLGHLRRNALIASGLSRQPLGATALLLAGARELARLPLPRGVECLTLPGFRKIDNGSYEPRRLGIGSARLRDLRTRVIEAALAAYDPDVLIVDKVPAGLGGELLPALPRLRDRGTRIVLGLREILDDPGQVRREWSADGFEDVIEAHYDAVWIYGDPAVFDLLREYRVREGVVRRARFTGYLDPRGHAAEAAPAPWTRGEPYAVCQVGGGEDGAALAEAFVETRLPSGMRGVLVQGPYLPEASRRRIRERTRGRSDMRVLGFVPGPLRLVAGASRVISMGGYNSVCELLATGRPGLVVPRVRPRQEQRIRAERMAALGVLDWIHPDALTPDALSDWLARAPATESTPATPIDFHGLGRLPRLTLDLGLRPGPQPEPPA